MDDRRARPNEDRIVGELEEDIIFGRLAPGARLTEDALVERFGGTRHFARRALARLERIGIVALERNRGASVRSFTREEVLQIYEVREMLQRHAAMRIPLPAPQSLIGELGEINGRYRAAIAAGDLRSTHELNDCFHITMFAACRNEHLILLVNEYMDVTLPIRATNLADPAMLDISWRQHDLMITYLQGSDPWILGEICVDHLTHGKRKYLDNLDSRAS